MTVVERTEPVAVAGRRLPAEQGMWLFLLADMSVFALFFGAYLWELGESRQAFMRSAGDLLLPLGLLNTLLLLSSSYAVVRAVDADRRDDLAASRRMLAWALAGAALFMLVKLIEYAMELAAGHGLTSSPFFSYYFVLTGLHLMHVVIGSGLLVAWRRSLRSPGGRHSSRRVESVAGYWHMVDLLWLLIFSFVYIGSNA